jgi:hypothetical protein
VAVVQRRHDVRLDRRRPLAQRLPPTSALHVAAAIVAIAPLAVLFGTVFLIPDKKTPIDLPALRTTFGSLVTAFANASFGSSGFSFFSIISIPASTRRSTTT